MSLIEFSVLDPVEQLTNSGSAYKRAGTNLTPPLNIPPDYPEPKALLWDKNTVCSLYFPLALV